MIELAQQAGGATGPNAEPTSLFLPRSYQLDLVELATHNNVSAAMAISSRYLHCLAVPTHDAPYTTAERCLQLVKFITARPMFFQLLSVDLLTLCLSLLQVIISLATSKPCTT